MARMLITLLIAAVLVVVLLFALHRVARIPDVSSRGTTRALAAEELALRAALMRDVSALASHSQRNALDMRALAQSAEFIEASFRASGLEPQRQTYAVSDVDYANVFAIVKGTTHPDEIVVIGAHYDSVFDSPGADDNASGVAGMLAVARALAKHPADRTIHFVAFATEEPPFFRSVEMGSHHYAKSLHDRRANVVSMMSVESIGYYSSKPRSQRYPSFLAPFFPSVADFIGVVSNLESRALARRCALRFGTNGVPVEAAALPSLVPEAGWSDQWSFWQFGYRAVMVTDTALFRNANYHTPNDTPETLDYDQMTRVVVALTEVVKDLTRR
jgi:Zn-dependent M28 family amino/carboxypeptidase